MATHDMLADFDERRENALRIGDALTGLRLSELPGTDEPHLYIGIIEDTYPTIGDFLRVPSRNVVAAPGMGAWTLWRLHVALDAMISRMGAEAIHPPLPASPVESGRSIGMRLLQRLLQMQELRADEDHFSHDVTLRNGTVIPYVWSIEIKDGIASATSGTCGIHVDGPTYHFDPDEVVMVAMSAQRTGAGREAVAWGVRMLHDGGANVRLRVMLRTGHDIQGVVVLEEDGDVADVETTTGTVLRVAMDDVVAIAMDDRPDERRT